MQKGGRYEGSMAYAYMEAEEPKCSSQPTRVHKSLQLVLASVWRWSLDTISCSSDPISPTTLGGDLFWHHLVRTERRFRRCLSNM
eukprot:1760858-Amphidinium_carterae.2